MKALLRRCAGRGGGVGGGAYSEVFGCRVHQTLHVLYFETSDRKYDSENTCPSTTKSWS